MVFLSSGAFYLVGGLIFLLLSLVLRQPKPVKSLSLLFLLLGGFNLFVDEQSSATPLVLIGAAILLIALFAVAYTYHCSSVLEAIGFLSMWRLTVAAYLPAFYISLLAVLLVWFIKTNIEQRGLALYVFVVFVLSIHLALLVSTITRPLRFLTSESVPTFQPLIPVWFWIAMASVVILAIVAELFGRKDWVLLSLNVLATVILVAPVVTVGLRSRHTWR